MIFDFTPLASAYSAIQAYFYLILKAISYSVVF